MNIENPDKHGNQHPFDKVAAEGWSLINSKESAAAKQRLTNRLQKKYTPQRSKVVPLSLLAIAASLAILFYVCFLDADFLGTSNVDLSLAGAIVVPTFLLKPDRAPTGEQVKRLDKGVAAYEKGQYQRAAHLFEEFIEDGGQQKGVMLYLGHSLLFEQPEKTIIVLTQFLETTQLDNNYKDYANWYLAIAYWETNQPVLAKRYWTVLSTSDSLFKAQAEEQLRTRFSVEH